MRALTLPPDMLAGGTIPSSPGAPWPAGRAPPPPGGRSWRPSVADTAPTCTAAPPGAAATAATSPQPQADETVISWKWNTREEMDSITSRPGYKGYVCGRALNINVNSMRLKRSLCYIS